MGDESLKFTTSEFASGGFLDHIEFIAPGISKFDEGPSYCGEYLVSVYGFHLKQSGSAQYFSYDRS